MKKLFLLSEEEKQEEFETEARYLYKSKFNLRMFHYLDSKEATYLYLSYTHGVLRPEERIKSYQYKKSLSKESKKIWSLVANGMLCEYLEDVESVFLFYSGNRYKALEDLLVVRGFQIISPIRNYNAKMRLTWLEHIISEGIFYHSR